MKPSEALASNRAAIRHVVESHRARNARVFGSVLRGQDTDSSDLDILIDPTPETHLVRHRRDPSRTRQAARCAGGCADAQRLARQLPGHGASAGSACMTRDQQRLADYLAHIAEAIERIDSGCTP